MYLKAKGLGLPADAAPVAVKSIVGGLLNDESLFFSGTRHASHSESLYTSRQQSQGANSKRVTRIKFRIARV